VIFAFAPRVSASDVAVRHERSERKQARLNRGNRSRRTARSGRYELRSLAGTKVALLASRSTRSNEHQRVYVQV